MFENRAGRVVNGFDTGQPLPYQLQLVLEINEINWRFQFCGATLVSKKYATTAHHCFDIINEGFKTHKQIFYFQYVIVIAGQYEKNGFGVSFSMQASSSTGQCWKI